MPKLTKRTVDSLKPGTYPYIAFDTEVQRFGVRVMVSGKKSYVVQYRQGGRTRRMTLGPHGTLTVEQARTRAKVLLGDVADGGDPVEQKATYQRAPTVAEVCDRFLSEHVAHRCKPSTQREYARSVALFIKPRLGTRKVVDIQRGDIHRLHEELRNVPYQANRTLGVLSKLFNLAEVWNLRPDGSNPCRHVRKYPEVKRARFLSAEEYARLGVALDAAERDGTESASAIAAFRLLLLTGCRLGEIQTLKWEHVAGDVLDLPDSKTGAKRVYLGAEAVELLARLPRVPGNPYVIVGTVEGRHLTDLQHPWRRVRDSARLPDVRLHDLRHSFASEAVRGGEGLPMIGKLLGHTQVQTTARYAHLADDPAKQAARRVSADIARAIRGEPKAAPTGAPS